MKFPDPTPWVAIITAVVLTTVGAGILFIVLYKFSCHCNDLWERHKDMADLDQLPVYPLTEIKGGLNKDYTGTDPSARDHMGGGGVVSDWSLVVAGRPVRESAHLFAL